MKSILVVEDDLFLGKYYWKLLEKAGYETSHLKNGVGVVDFVKKRSPDLKFWKNLYGSRRG